MTLNELRDAAWAVRLAAKDEEIAKLRETVDSFASAVEAAAYNLRKPKGGQHYYVDEVKP